MESANDIFDCYSWSKAIPLYKKTSKISPPTSNSGPVKQNASPPFPRSSSSHSDRALTIDDSDNDHARPSTPHRGVIGPIRHDRGRPRKSSGGTPNSISNKSWGSILAMQECKLDSVLQSRLKANPSDDAIRFSRTPLPLLNDLDERSIPSIKVLTCFCRKVEEMSNQMPEDRVHWLFLVLTVGDMAALLFGLKSSSNKRDVSASIISKEGDDAWEEIQSTVSIANNLVFICSKLGNGCLFWLHGELTKIFLLNRVTRAGRAYDEAMEHLHNLKLRENVEASGAKRLGDAIRSHLRNLYQIGELTSDAANVIDASSDEHSIIET